jgi:hypothetical protein
MNDFQKLMSVFDTIGCEYKVITSKEVYNTETHKDSHDGEIEFDTAIQLDNGIGYFEFSCLHYFLNGEYKGHGCWE